MSTVTLAQWHPTRRDNVTDGSRSWAYNLPLKHPTVYAFEHPLVQILAKPHHTWALQPGLASRAAWQLLLLHMFDAVIRVEQWQGLAGWHIFRGGCQRRAEGVVHIIALDPLTPFVAALDIEEGSVEVVELLQTVAGTFREVCPQCQWLRCVR